MSNAHAVIVDDRFLTYEGSWGHDGASVEYNVTTTRPLESGANATFQFVGTAVAVFGTWGIGNNPTTCQFAVDGSNIANFTTSLRSLGSNRQYHTEFYSASNLTDGTHTLDITITKLNVTSVSNHSNFFLDYFIYTPSTNPSLWSLMPGEAYFYDDTDPALQYSGAWSTADGAVVDMQGTLHTALSLSSSVSLEFTGTYIDVYGSLPEASTLSAIATFVIDDGEPFISEYPTTKITFDPSTKSSPNYRLYHNPSLASGSHVLKIIPSALNALYLDYITTGISADTLNGSGSAPDAPSSGAQVAQPRSLTGIIAGATIGGLAALALIAIGFWIWRRRRRRRQQERPIVDLSMPLPLRAAAKPSSAQADVHVTPFVFQRNTPLREPESNIVSSSEETTQVPDSRRPATLSVANPSESPPPSPAEKSVDPSPTSASTHVVQHQDSEIRGLLPPEGVLTEEIPPVYRED